MEVVGDIKPSADPTIYIFRPTNPGFPVFDVLVFYWNECKLIDVFGYQLKKGNNPPAMKQVDAAADFQKYVLELPAEGKCVWVHEDPPKSGATTGQWVVPSGDTTNAFFGESGRFWTPRHWKQLIDTYQTRDEDDGASGTTTSKLDVTNSRSADSK